MKLRVKVSIVLCGVFALLSSAAFFLHGYLGGGHPGISSQSFAPVKIKKVPDEEDVFVTLYPCGLAHHGYNAEDNQVKLNTVKKGWIIAQYRGYCRVIFRMKDADIEQYRDTDPEHDFYYVEKVSRDRLRITDYTARLGDEPADPFTGRPAMLPECSIETELGHYNYQRYGTLSCIALNAVFILLAAGINLMISAVQKRINNRG